MKKTIRLSSSLLTVLLTGMMFVSQSCKRNMCEVTETYTKYTPVYMSYADLRAQDAVKSQAPRDIERPGKIYVKDNLLFINEYRKGIHVIDNANPSAPIPLAFIEIPGNIDLAVKGDILYADSYVDLLAINIGNPSAIYITQRSEDALPYQDYENFTWLDPAQGVVKEWIEEEVTETFMTDCNSGGGGWLMNEDVTTFNSGVQNGVGGSNGTNNPNPGSAGTGGSMARFTIVNDYLYTVNDRSMVLFDISNNYSPTAGPTIDIGWNIETIFPYGDKLYIGSRNGMYIYDNSNPASPTQMSVLQHFTSCDPVVVQDDYAYVTLRGGTPCGGFTNQLDVVDVSNPYQPKLMDTHELDGPYGLGVDGSSLFICDGETGLRIWNVDDPLNAYEVDLLKNFDTFDVIPLGGTLMVIGPDGLLQFDYSDPTNLVLLSIIPVVNN